MSRAQEYEDVARKWIAASARGDIDAAFALLGSRFRRIGGDDRVVWDREQYELLWRSYSVAFSEYRLDLINLVNDGSIIVAEMVESARFTAPFIIPGNAPLSPSGESYTDFITVWLAFDDLCLISEVRTYITGNLVRIMAQPTVL